MERITLKTLFATAFYVGLRPSRWFGPLVFTIMFGSIAGIVHAEAVFLASPAVSGSGGFDKVIEYDSITGTIVREFVYSPAPTNWTPVGVALGPDGNLYVASQTRQQADGAEIIKVNLVTGTLSVFATEGIGGIFGITFGPNGNLFASSACGVGSPSCGPDSPKVVEYDGATGALVGTFIGGLLPPAGGIAFGPNGNLFIGGDGEVVEYDGQTGAFVGTFASQGLSRAVNGLTFAPGGNLIVADTNNGVMEFEGVTGNLLRIIDDDLRAAGVAFDANGFLLASSNELDAPIRQYEWPSGNLLGTYVESPSGFPHGITAVTAELPEPTIDAILIFFDASVADGSLIGDGPGNSADKRLNALRNMLEMAGDLINIDDIEGACGQLHAALGKCDGESPPPDFVTGSAAPGLCAMISDLMTELGCE